MSATVDGLQCSEAEITIPAYGAPWGRCTMADAMPVPAIGSQVLFTIASIEQLCTVLEADDRGGVTSLELVGGYGGWHKSPPEPAAYRNDAGVSLAEAAGKLAEAVGEAMIPGDAAERTVGPHLAVAGGDVAPAASALLSQLCALPEGSTRLRWYVETTGGTRIGNRLPLPEVEAIEIDRDPRGTWVAFAEEDAQPMLPGATIGGREIAELRITASPNETRQVVTLAAEQPQSLAAKFWRLILDIVRPWFLWRTLYTYRVTRIRAGNRPDLVPVSSRVAPALEAVRIWPGVGGNITKPHDGAQCIVAFADGNPNAPIIVGWQPQLASTSNKWKPQRADYDADEVYLAAGTKPVGRGGATLAVAQGLANPNAAVITLTTPNGAKASWQISSATAALVVGVAPEHAISGAAVIDEGRAQVKV